MPYQSKALKRSLINSGGTSPVDIEELVLKAHSVVYQKPSMYVVSIFQHSSKLEEVHPGILYMYMNGFLESFDILLLSC